jgi:hypothetical protein
VQRPRSVRPTLEFLEARETPSVDVWTGANHAKDINWSDGANWSLGHAPGASDVAVFTSSSVNPSVVDPNSVEDGAYSIAGLQIDGSWGATLTLNGNLTLASGSSNLWDSGTIVAGQGVSLINNGTLTLKNTSNVVFSTLGSGGTLQNNGTIDQAGAGNLDLAGTNSVASTLNNAAGAVYNFQGDASIGYGGGAGGAVVNAGTFEKTVGTATSEIAQPLTNSGTLQANTGTLGINANSTNTGGTFAVGSGAILNLTNGAGYTFTENGTFTATGVGSGAGTIVFNSGTLAAGSSGATVSFSGTPAPAFQWNGGTIYVPTNATLTYNGLLTLLNSANVILDGGGTFLLSAGNTIDQAGKGNLDLAGDSTGNVTTTLQIAKTATYDFQADSSIGYGGGPGGTVVNSGTIEKTVGTASSLIAEPFTNSGTLEVTNGTLGIDADSTNTGGTFAVGAGAILDLTDGNGYTFTENGTFTATGVGSGAGTIVFSNGTLAAGSSGATVSFSGTPAPAFQWNGGTIYVPTGATLTYNGLLTLLNSSNVGLDGGGTFLLSAGNTIDQAGKGNLDLAGDSSGNVATTLQIAATATYDFQADSSIGYGGGPGGTVVNSGTIEKTAGTASSLVAQPLTNTGTLDAASGTLEIDASSTNTGGTYTAAAGATLDLTGGQTFSETGTFAATGAGTISVNSGTLAVYNNAATLSIPATISFQASGGTISVPTNDTLTINGNLTLIGTANTYLSGGGTLTENGTITQSGSGNLDLAGNSAGTVATTLVIPKGSFYDFTANSGIGYGGGPGGVVTNTGTIEKTAGGGSSPINVSFNNTGGTLTVQTGTLTLDSTGGESTGGIFNVSAGAILDLTGGQTVGYAGTYTGSGTGEVLLDSGTLNVTGGTNGATFNLPGNLFVWSGGTIDTATNNNLTILGNMKITGAVTEYLSGGGSLAIGSSTASGTVNDTGTFNTLNLGGGSTLSIGPKGTFNIADDTINGNGMISLAGGALVKTAGTSGATIATVVDNQGKVQVNNGTLLFNNTVDQVFNNVLTGGMWIVNSTATTQSTLDISSASFNTIGLGAVVTLSGPNSSFSNLSGLVANQGTFTLASAASFTTPGNFSNSGGLTLSPGSVLSVNGAFTETSTAKLTVQIGGTNSSPTFGSIASTGAVSLQGNTMLTVTSSVTPPVNSSFEVLNNGSSSPISGIFAGLPEGATFTVKVGSTTMTFKITYVGGTGHSVVITRIS